MPRISFLLLVLFTGSLCVAAETLPTPLDFTAIQHFLDARPDVATVEAFLHELPDAYRQHYVLMHTSSSLQGSSFERPRVLSVGIDGNFALAFAGSDDVARGNTVEMYAFDRKKRAFEFREIVFENGHAKLSAANPPLCLGCHGADPRPVWGSYPVWKGAYAEYRPNGYSADPPDIVAKNRAFYDAQPNLPRYRELRKYQVGEQSDHNVGFMHLLQEANDLRVARLMEATPFFSAYKYALLGAHVCQSPVDPWLNKFLPAALAAKHRASYRPEFKRENNLGAFDLYAQLFETRRISTAAWPTVIDVLDSRSSSRFSITEPHDYDTFSAGRVAYAFTSGDSELAGLGHAGSAATTSVVTIEERNFEYLEMLPPAECDQLAAKSRGALAAVLQTQSPDAVFSQSAQASARTPRDVLQSCANCHGGGDTHIPAIPFADIPALAQWLAETPGAREKLTQVLQPAAGSAQMPPGNPLPSNEREALLAFLAAL